MAVTGARVWIGLAGWLLAAFGAAAVGSQFLPGEWYAQLTKPAWNPPNWVFGPVWTLLYAMMGVSAWLVWKDAGFKGATTALSLFGVQLALNAAWSWFFFGLLQPGLALVDIVLLWIAIFATLISFWRIRGLAGALLVPYLAWVTFASALNFSIWQLNR